MQGPVMNATTICCLTALAASLAPPAAGGASPANAPSAASTSGFKITYSLKNRRHGALWNGGVEDASRVRSVQGWHLHDDDRLRPPNLWDIQLHSVGGAIAAPGVILDLLGPGSQLVSVFSRREDIDFVPEEIPYGKIFHPAGFNGDVAVERVPIAQPSHPPRTRMTARRCCEHAPGATGSLGSPTRLVPATVSTTKAPTKSR